LSICGPAWVGMKCRFIIIIIIIISLVFSMGYLCPPILIALSYHKR